MKKLIKRIIATVVTVTIFAASAQLSRERVFAAGETGATISAGHNFTMAIKADGSLWAWGSNQYGQLGNGTTLNKNLPIKVMDDVASISAGDSHVMAIKTDGSLWSWGMNSGQLGDTTIIDRSTPAKIMDGVTSVSAGNDHTMAIKIDGSLWAWGRNNYGQLGDGTKVDRAYPIKIMDGVNSVSAGYSQTMAIKADGSLWAWGYNAFGQLGNGSKANLSDPVKIMDGVKSVSSGAYHTMAIKTDASLWAWGRNNYGQLGDGTKVDKEKPIKIMDSAASVDAGNYHNMAIKTDGTLWAWGLNEDGQLGNGTTIDETKPIKITDKTANNTEKITEKTKSVAIGYAHTITVRADGFIWVWGANSDSQLGDGTASKNKPSPLRIMDGIKTPERSNVIEFNGTFSQIKLPIKNVDGRSLLPFREFSELLGATVSWDQNTKKATSEVKGRKVEFIIGSKKYYVNGAEKTMDVASFIDNGSTYIPLRYAAEGLGFKVDFKQTDTVNTYIISVNK